MEIIDNINKTLKEDMIATLRSGSKVAIAASSFSIYAFQELKEQLGDISELRFIFTSPSFITEKTDKQKREFYIPRLNRERNLYGSEFEIKLRNELSLKAVAKECAEWIRKKVCFKSNRTNAGMPAFATVDDTTYMPINGFTTVELGCERGNNLATAITKMEAPFTQQYLQIFNQIWNDSGQLQVVTEQVLDSVTIARSRRHIEQYYDTTDIGKFPERLKPISLRPNLTDLPKTVDFNDIFVSVSELNLAIKLREKLDFNKVLTLFSPISKDRTTLYPKLNEEIDVLIATDCISEGQNLQDCDFLINYDIHWNPVRIIQRFGRIYRIGSQNEKIQLVNFWPNMDLDDYIDLKGRVEARMKVSVLTATGDENPLSVEEQGDLKYRRDQLERLKEEVVDIEKMNTGVSIMDLGLNEFRLDLLEYMRSGVDIEHTPMGLHVITNARKDAPKGVIFVLKNRNNDINIDKKNRLHPFYMVYISQDSEVIVNHLDPKGLLDRMRQLCRGKSEPIAELCRKFNAETRDGQRMGTYSRLLGDAITSLIKVKESTDLFSFLDGDSGSLFGNEVKGLDDFELICFLIVR